MGVPGLWIEMPKPWAANYGREATALQEAARQRAVDPSYCWNWKAATLQSVSSALAFAACFYRPPEATAPGSFGINHNLS